MRRYEFGTDKCNKTNPGSCGIVRFLQQRIDLATQILAHLQALPDERKSAEIRSAEKFLQAMINGADQAQAHNPCLTAGDILIALESAGISHFMMLNGAESQHLCRALQQTLIVHPVDPTKAEIVCLAESQEWPKFGQAKKAEEACRNGLLSSKSANQGSRRLRAA